MLFRSNGLLVDSLRFACVLRERQHREPIDHNGENAQALQQDVKHIRSQDCICSIEGEQLCNLFHTMRVSMGIDLWLGELEHELGKLEMRAQAFHDGKPTRPDRVLAKGLALFPGCVNPMLDLINKEPDMVLRRQVKQIGRLMARHFAIPGKYLAPSRV